MTESLVLLGSIPRLCITLSTWSFILCEEEEGLLSVVKAGSDPSLAAVPVDDIELTNLS